MEHKKPYFYHDRKQRNISDARVVLHNKTYTLRSSRVTSSQKKSYDNGMKKYGLTHDLNDSATHTLDQKLQNSGVLLHEYDNLVIDIGFGAGETLFDMALRCPRDIYVGIETYRSGVGGLLSKILSQEKQFSQYVPNIRIYHADAVPILFHDIENESIDRIQIFFPDPWPKAKHHKRRLLQRSFLLLCYQLLKENGSIWIVTDWQAYAEAIKDEFEKTHMLNWRLNDMYCIQLEEIRSRSRFENKGLQKGHGIYPLVYTRYSDISV